MKYVNEEISEWQWLLKTKTTDTTTNMTTSVKKELVGWTEVQFIRWQPLQSQDKHFNSLSVRGIWINQHHLGFNMDFKISKAQYKLMSMYIFSNCEIGSNKAQIQLQRQNIECNLAWQYICFNLANCEIVRSWSFWQLPQPHCGGLVCTLGKRLVKHLRGKVSKILLTPVQIN